MYQILTTNDGFKMAIKKYKSITPGTRWRTGYGFEEITKTEPEKSLIEPLKNTGGRNAHGRITSRHRGGAHKKAYRLVDFRRDKLDMPAKVTAIEYDPNRSARIALLEYQDGELRYILCPDNLKVDDEILSSAVSAEAKIGNHLALKNVPLGVPVHNVELKKGFGGQIARSAGNSCTVLAKEGSFAHVRLPSGEVRLIDLNCFATIGQVGNIEHDSISIGKAGRNRWLGLRPSSRGVAKNPHDHPMGGGEGKSSGGRHPCSPWGQLAKGLKTRKRKKSSDRFIIKRRK